MKKLVIITVLFLTSITTLFAQKKGDTEKRYTYYENDGVYMYYETKEKKLIGNCYLLSLVCLIVYWYTHLSMTFIKWMLKHNLIKKRLFFY